MKKVVMFYEGRLFPSADGTARAVASIARFLNGRSDVRLTLVVLDNGMTDEGLRKCQAVCHEFVRLEPVPRWSLTGVLNSLVRRLGGDVRKAWFRARAARGRMAAICADADLVLVNGTAWYPVVSQAVRRTKTVVITHDLLFQRRESLRGRDLWSNRRKRDELKVLKTFRTVAVFADYERDLLTAAGFPAERIVRIGMPIDCPPAPTDVIKKYDFLFVGSGFGPNVEAIACFFDRIVPHLGARRISLAVVGGICRADVWSRVKVPANVEVVRLGVVDELASVCASARIGVSTPPHGSGIKVKTVECIEYGLPMVVTNCGVEGIPVTDEGTVNVDALPSEEIARRIGAWLDDPESAAEAGRLQAEKVRQAFSPSRLEALLA